MPRRKKKQLADNYLRRGDYVFVAVCVYVCRCVCVQKSQKKYERILRNLRCGSRNSQLDFGGDLDPLPQFCPNFILVMHMQ